MKARRVFASAARFGQRRWTSEKPPVENSETQQEKVEIPKETDSSSIEAVDKKEAEREPIDALFDDTSERRLVNRTYPTPEEMLEKYGVLAQMDDRHKHLTEREYAQLWWKVRDTYTAVTEDIWDIHTTQQMKDNWEATWQLFVRRLPPHIQLLYQESFNKKYLSFRPPKVALLGMPPPTDYLEVWQAEQPTFYIRETLKNPLTFTPKTLMWGLLDKFDMTRGWTPRGGYAKLQVAHPLINDNPNPHYVFSEKRLPGQVCKLLPESKEFPSPKTTRRLSWFGLKKPVGNSPDFLSLPWIEIVSISEIDEIHKAEIKLFKSNSRDAVGNPSADYTLETVDLDRVIGGADRLDYISLGERLIEPETRDIIRFLWPAPLLEGERVKYHYSQEGYEYPWEFATVRETSANEFSVHALLLPYEFISKREPDLPNTLGKISIVVNDREYPIMVDFWDALKRFHAGRRNIKQMLAQIFVIIGGITLLCIAVTTLYKIMMVGKLIKPYNVKELQVHERYKHIYGQGTVARETGKGPWSYEKD